MQIIFKIPEKSHLKIQKNQEVDFQTPLYFTENEEINIIQISEKLKTKPEDIFNFLKKGIGESVLKGDLIAEKKGLFSSFCLYSDFEGVIKEINHIDGNLLISSVKEETKEYSCFFKGLIANIQENEITVEIKTKLDFNAEKTDSNFGGEYILLNKEKDVFSLDADEIENKVIVTEEISGHLKSKCKALGAIGFIFVNGDFELDFNETQITQKVLEKIQEKKHNYLSVFKSEKKILIYD